ncbi:cell division protein FtsL [Miniphocaeibacter massiliensis]|uniref:cell division protein FtsL n=1 Tax=Miniphocaeibacter massiliensis TaxID=2041841 RepID=UPI000C06E166|nr:cell division protein FtsL [Miniphocaeibacter massiliensis]
MEARNYEYIYEDIYIDDAVRNTAIPIPREKNRVRKKVKVKSKIIGKKIVLMSILGINLFMVGITLQSYMTTSGASAQITKLNKEITELEATRDYYKFEVEKYSSTERIEDIAKNKLGMYYPKEDQYIYIPTEK